jgi:hypothetical protein
MRETEKSMALQGAMQKLGRASKEQKRAVVESLDDETARAVLAQIEAAPGDDPEARRLIGEKLAPLAPEKLQLPPEDWLGGPLGKTTKFDVRRIPPRQGEVGQGSLFGGPVERPTPAAPAPRVPEKTARQGLLGLAENRPEFEKKANVAAPPPAEPAGFSLKPTAPIDRNVSQGFKQMADLVERNLKPGWGGQDIVAGLRRLAEPGAEWWDESTRDLLSRAVTELKTNNVRMGDMTRVYDLFLKSDPFKKWLNRGGPEPR